MAVRVQRDELRKILKVNNVSYHRHGDRRSNQMKSKTEMAEQLCGIVASGNFGALAQCAMPARTRRPHPLRPSLPFAMPPRGAR